MNIISKCFSFKQRDKEYRLLRDCNIANDNDLSVDIKRLQNIWTVNRLFSEYKKETGMRFFSIFKNSFVDIFWFHLIYIFYILVSILFMRYGNFFLQLYFGGSLIINSLLLIGYFIREYYIVGKEIIISNINKDKNESESEKTVYKVVKKLNSLTEKDLILVNLNMKDNNISKIKTRRL